MSSANQPQRASILNILFWTGIVGMTVLVAIAAALARFSPVRSFARPRPQQSAPAPAVVPLPESPQNVRLVAEAAAAGSGWTLEELAEIVRLNPQLEAKSWEIYRRGVYSLKPEEKLLVYSLVKLPLARAKRKQGLPLTDKELQILQFGDAKGIP